MNVSNAILILYTQCASTALLCTFWQRKTFVNSYRACHMLSSRTIAHVPHNLIITGTMHSFFSSMPQTGWKRSRKVGLNANSSQFTLEGEPFRILGGSVHYFRVPRAYWRDRLMKMKACGINTLTTYVPWSLHQPEKGAFNFHTQLDLEAYISLAAELGLWVILRPGPYISADMDLGGLPSWLLRDGSMRLRTTHPGFTQAVNTYFDKLIPKVVPLQFKKGGPIIAVQVEDEYGSFAKDQGYMVFIKEALQSRGISELLLTSDNTNTLKSLLILKKFQPNNPSMVMEYWTGWYDAWGDLHHNNINTFAHTIFNNISIKTVGMSVNLYMFHGGSSFGFMSGAVSDPSYRALVSSYDYDPPLSEDGSPTWCLRAPVSPQGPHMKVASQSDYCFPFPLQPFKSSKAISMENLPANNANGQSYGYTLYETTITSGGLLQSGDNDKRTLSFLVENCGRVHRGRDLDKQHKGDRQKCLQFITLPPLKLLLCFKMCLKESYFSLYQAPWKNLPENPSFPGFFMGRLFAYGYPSDTFVKLPGWEKGVVFINGLNLGRYWSIGPQQALYLPGPFLNSGINQVFVFEEQEGDYKVYFEDSPDLGMAAEIQ
uniref:Beta-galactosidase n=1 Tax=Fundulus heteroclitus TaxID=8078 RepID=A0A3Q2PHG5_FUNHE